MIKSDLVWRTWGSFLMASLWPNFHDTSAATRPVTRPLYRTMSRGFFCRPVSDTIAMRSRSALMIGGVIGLRPLRMLFSVGLSSSAFFCPGQLAASLLYLKSEQGQDIFRFEDAIPFYRRQFQTLSRHGVPVI
jgi:hypothetical protein